MAFSFSTAGSTPGVVYPLSAGTLNFPSASTPQSKALSSAIASYQPPAAPSAPTNQTVTSHTVSPDGTVKQTYDASSGTTSKTPASSPTFPGLLGTVASQGANPSTIQSQATGEAQNAYGTYQEFIAQKKALEEQEAEAEKANSLNPVPMGDITGRGQALHNYFATKESAAGTAAQGAAGLFSPALSGAISAQGQQFGAAQNAASLAQPQQVSQQNVPFNPATGTYGSPAYTAYGSGGLAKIGAITQQQQQGADVQNMSSYYNQTSGLINNFNNQFAADFNQNPAALGNALTQWLNTGVVPDPKYSAAIATLQEIANTIAPVLGANGAPTDMKTVIANELVPRLMQGQGISQVLQQLEYNAATKIDQAKQTATGTPLNTTIPQTSPSPTAPVEWATLADN